MIFVLDKRCCCEPRNASPGSWRLHPGGRMSPRFTKAPPQTGLPETDSSVLKGQLTKLGLHSVAATFEAEADRATKSETTYPAYLGRLVELELADKADRSINARIARARFRVLRTLEQFDFNFQPSLSAARVRELAHLTFLDQAVNVLFVGGLTVFRSGG